MNDYLGEAIMTETLASLAVEINRAHDDARRSVAEGLESARRAGGLLQQAKRALPHGEWLPWLSKNCEVSERTAQAYMRIAREWPTLAAKAQRVADLPIREALAFLAVPRVEESQAIAARIEMEVAVDLLNRSFSASFVKNSQDPGDLRVWRERARRDPLGFLPTHAVDVARDAVIRWIAEDYRDPTIADHFARVPTRADLMALYDVRIAELEATTV